MKTKKIIAAVSAIVLTAASTASAVPAFASEVTAVQAQAYVNSFTNSDTQKVAQYCIDNGLSLDETMDLMADYEEGLELIAEREISPASTFDTGEEFYSGTSVAVSPHFGVLIAADASASVYTTLTLTMSLDYVYYDFSTLDYTFLDNHSDLSVRKLSTNKMLIAGDVTNVSTESTPTGVVEIPFEALSNDDGTSEAAIYHAFTLKRTSCAALNGKDTTFTFETGALGDIDHNGVIDSADNTYLLQFLVGSISNLSFSYTDKSDAVASIVLIQAMDANQDGSIGLADSVKISGWISDEN